MMFGIRANVVINLALSLLGVGILIIKRKDWFCNALGLENKYYHEKLEENNDGKYSFI